MRWIDERRRHTLMSYDAQVSVDELREWCSARGHVEVVAFDSKRYVGAQIGIHNPEGKKVGRVGRTRNVEYLVVAGPPAAVARMCAGYPRPEDHPAARI